MKILIILLIIMNLQQGETLKLTDYCSSHQAEGDGDTRASSLEASLSSHRSVFKVALEIKDVDQPGGRKETQRMKHCRPADSSQAQ